MMSQGGAGSSQSRHAFPDHVLAMDPDLRFSIDDAILSSAENQADAVASGAKQPVAATFSEDMETAANPAETHTAARRSTEPLQSHLNGITPGKKRLKRGSQSSISVNYLNCAARTLALSLAKVIRNASNPDFTHEVLQILGVAESGKALEETLYGCAYAQLNIAALKSQSGRKEKEKPSSLQHIPGGCPMDNELQDLAKEATRLVGGVVGITSSALKEPEYESLVATAQAAVKKELPNPE